MADFHAADLWVAIVPETSKVGPAMEEAGKQAKDKFRDSVKDFGKTIHDDLDKIAAKAKETARNAGTDYQDTAREISGAFKKLWEWNNNTDAIDGLKNFGKKASDALRGELGQGLKGAITEALGGLTDVQTTLGAIDGIAKRAGVDISGWTTPLSEAATKSDDIKASVTTFAGAFKDMPGSVGKVATALTELAGPIGIAIAGAKQLADELDKVKFIHDRFFNPDGTYKSGFDRWISEHGGSIGRFFDPLPPPTPADPNDRTPRPVPPNFNPGSGGGHFAGGGALFAPGPKGKDSALFFGAPGEHVWTAAEVDAAGGHGGMHALRSMALAGFFKNIRGLEGGGEVGGTDWDAVAQGESHGDWHINTGNGYYGGLQFNLATWREFGGLDFADRPDHATREQQIAVANRVPVNQRAGRWPQTYQLGAGRGGGGGGLGGGHPKGSKAGLQPAASNLWEVIAANFPQIGEIGGVRADPLPYHPSGRALDIMIPGAGGLNDPTPPGAKAIGDKIYQFLMANAAALGVDTSGTLWQQKDHYNHIHAQLLDHFKGFTDASQFGGKGGGSGQLPTGTEQDPLYVTRPKSGEGAGTEGGPFTSHGEQLGQGLIKGALQMFGLDGSVFGGKSPLDFTAVKWAGGLASWAMGKAGAGGGGGGMAGGGGGLLGGLAGLLPSPGPSISAAARPGDERAAAGLGGNGGGTQVHVDNSMVVRDNNIVDNKDLVRRVNWEQNSRRGIGSQVQTV